MKFHMLAAALIASVALAAPAAAEAKKKKKTVHRAERTYVRSAPVADPYSVYVSGEYIGRDPDLNIRMYMIRNPHQWDGPN